jgi:hypothetical protein
MERSTKHSTLSGFSGILVGLFALVGVAATDALLHAKLSGAYSTDVLAFGAIWLAVIGLSISTDFVLTKSRAVRVGKQVFSKLGGQMIRAALPGFALGLMITLFCVQHQDILGVWPYWMFSYGIAICSVGQFSVREVSWLGWAFIVAGAATLCLNPALGLVLMAVSFGGFHIVYGLFTGITRKDW